MPFVRRISNLFARSRVERDIDAEMQAHLAMRAEDNIAAGLTPEAARRDALIRFGNPGVIKEKTTAADAVLILDTIWQDLRYGIHGLLTSPGFAITALLTLGLGIGINASLYSLASGILRPLPIREPGRVGVIVGTNSSYDDDRSPLSAPSSCFCRSKPGASAK
jgi:hypothetical protein